jgi:WD40 repeat protein
LSGGQDQCVKAWDVRTGRCVERLAGHRGAVRCLATLDDYTVLSGATDGTVRVWKGV